MTPACDRFGCHAPAEQWCPLCERSFCPTHDELPNGHACLTTFDGLYNALRVLEPDEQVAALERFRPMPS